MPFAYITSFNYLINNSVKHSYAHFTEEENWSLARLDDLPKVAQGKWQTVGCHSGLKGPIGLPCHITASRLSGLLILQLLILFFLPFLLASSPVACMFFSGHHLMLGMSVQGVMWPCVTLEVLKEQPRRKSQSSIFLTSAPLTCNSR